MTNKAFLIILDGWGLGKRPEVDAIQQANTPYYDKLMDTCPHATLITYGENVGLPEGQMGNSEVGHLNIGAGRIVYQQLARINKACKEKTLGSIEEFEKLIAYAKENNKPIHLLGLLSDGGVHSHIDHLQSIVTLLKEQGVEESYIHAFLDGRDTAPHGGKEYVRELLSHLENTPTKLASIVGRYYAMDRDNRYERIKKAYDLLVHGKGKQTNNPIATIQSFYDEDITDEFMEAISVTNDDETSVIKDGDAVLFFNFRTDRPRQLTTALTQQDFEDYQMRKLKLYYVTMTEYDKHFENIHILFKKENVQNTLGEVIQNAGLTQLRIAETEKYPHVTYFFSGGKEAEFDNESRIMVPSPKVATYDLQPEMSAPEITKLLMNNIETETPDFICLNFANTDMVGHTGVMEAAVKAAETVDGCLSQLIPLARKHQYEIIVIADHGNSDIMVKEDGSPHTAHTTNLVPVIYVGSKSTKTIKNGKLADIAPTLLGLMDLQAPKEMDGENLLA